MVFNEELSVSTSLRCCWVDLTSKVRALLKTTGINSGIVVVSSKHTTAGLTINENADPDVQLDFFSHLAKIFPKDPSFRHMEGNSDSHLKTSYTGLSVTVPIVAGDLVLGVWQSIYFCEFDGPRNRKASVTILGE